MRFIPLLRTAVSTLFGTRDWFSGRQFFHKLGGTRCFGDDSSALHLFCTLFLLLLLQLHLRSSGIRSRKLGTPVLSDVRKGEAYQGKGICLFMSGITPPNPLLPKSLRRLHTGEEAEAGGGRAHSLAFTPGLHLSAQLPKLRS